MYEIALVLLMNTHNNSAQSRPTRKWGNAMFNIHTNATVRTFALLIGSASILAAPGCCTRTASKMQDNWDRSFQLQWKCCEALSTAALKDKCFAKLQAATGAIGGLIAQWTSACTNESQDLMADIARQITESVTGCLPGEILGSIGGAVNLNSPFRDITEIALDIEPISSSAFEADGTSMLNESQSSAMSNSILRGEICFSIGDAYLCGIAKGRLNYIATPDHDTAENSYRPTRFNLNLAVPGFATQLKLIPHEENRLTIGRDGSGLLEVAMSLDAPASSGILQKEVWLEFPVVRTLGGVAIKSDGISGLELAPEAPPAFADWNSDGYVDDLDYAQFMVDFIAQETDLNLDRQVNDEDFTIFVDIWEGAL